LGAPILKEFKMRDFFGIELKEGDEVCFVDSRSFQPSER